MGVPSAACAGSVAITVDDLPIFATDFPPMRVARAITHGLLGGFRRHNWPVIGFVNETQLEGPHRMARIALLRDWIGAGDRLGNHSYSHYSLTKTPAPIFIRDIARGDHVTRPLMARAGMNERWFRFPYLETGATAPARDAVAAWLTRHHYRSAPVSMENSDWEFAEPYDDALAHGNPARAAEIRHAYLAYTAAMVAWYRSATRTLLGREPAFVFLIHANRLNSVSIDALAAILREAGLHAVPLETALRDPAYAIPDPYIGPKGLAWPRRWALALHRSLPDDRTLPRIPPTIARRYAEIEAADPDVAAPPALAHGR